jgi:ketosteroid isomerase-like protein
MSRENVEFVKALYPRPDTDVCTLFRDEGTFGRMREVLSAVLTDDFESVFVFPGETRASPGLDGFRKHWLDWLEPWETYRTAIDEVIDAGDRVLLLLRDHGRREGMDAEVEIIGASIATVREGKLARWTDYADRTDAFEAIGANDSA